MMRILPVSSEEDLETAREVLQEYGRSVGCCGCVQNLDRETALLSDHYGPPEGIFLLASRNGVAAGCFALSKVAEGVGEMKCLFVRPGFRGEGLGRKLVLALLDEARKSGCKKMVLETVPSMREAIHLYRSLGFLEIPPYKESPVREALYFGFDLLKQAPDPHGCSA